MTSIFVFSRAESKTPDSPELEDSEAEEGECVPPKDNDEAADFKPRGKVRKPRIRKQSADDYDNEKSPWSKKAYEPESFKPLRKGRVTRFSDFDTGFCTKSPRKTLNLVTLNRRDFRGERNWRRSR